MPKRNVMFTKPPEPAFLKRMKMKIGYEEPPSIETKKQIILPEQDEKEELVREDEKPIVVALNPEDEKLIEIYNANEKGEGSCETKLVFRKPVKKESEESDLQTSSSKKNKIAKLKSKSIDNKAKKIKNSSLLSFDDEDY